MPKRLLLCRTKVSYLAEFTLRSVAFKATRSIQESISTLYFGVVLLLQGWDNSLSQGYPSELNPPARVAQQQQQQ